MKMLTERELDLGIVSSIDDTLLLSDWTRCQPAAALSGKGKDVIDYIMMGQGTPVICCPRRGAGMTFDGRIIQEDHPGDPTAADDKQDRFLELDYDPLEILERVLRWYDPGAKCVLVQPTRGEHPAAPYRLS
ncbi:MAG: hypothetical protein ACPL7J_09490 [Desulfomonilaceae bacterium]